MRAEDLEGNKMIETIVKVDGMMCGMCESHVTVSYTHLPSAITAASAVKIPIRFGAKMYMPTPVLSLIHI